MIDVKAVDYPLAFEPEVKMQILQYNTESIFDANKPRLDPKYEIWFMQIGL